MSCQILEILAMNEILEFAFLLWLNILQVGIAIHFQEL